MAKRKQTAAERKRAEKIAAMAADIERVFAGASGGGFALEFGADMTDLMRIIPAVCHLYDIRLQDIAVQVLFALDAWSTPETLAEWLHNRKGWFERLRKERDEAVAEGGDRG